MTESTDLPQELSEEPTLPASAELVEAKQVPEAEDAPVAAAQVPAAEDPLVPAKQAPAAEDALVPVAQVPVAEEAAAPEEEAPQGLDGVPEPLAAAMRRRGFSEITSVQRAVLDAESEGRDLRVSSQTGSGKTVAIGLALARDLIEEADQEAAGPKVLVMVPTRELAMQVREELGWLFGEMRRLRIEVVMGGTSLGLERRALDRRPQIVVGTPGRVLDHLKSGALKSQSIDHVVLDESDRMLDMGFRDELEAILELLPKERRTHLVSATFPTPVKRLADRYQSHSLHVQGTRLGDANRDIQHIAHVVEDRDCYAALVNLLLLNEGGRCLIFVERRMDTTRLAEKLSGDGFPVQAFSGELQQAQRTRTLSAFRDGTIKTLVSTDVAARGIDVPDIELVLHVDPPSDADTYVHRSGRTGRAGRAGRSVMLVSPRARRHISRLLSINKIEAEWKPAPGAGKVSKQLRKQFRQQIYTRLSDEGGPSQAQIDYAKGLLDGRDPATVLALLLEMAQPAPVRAPMDVAAVADHQDGPRGGNAAAAGYVRFTINWGEKGGCATNRLLGHVCRRGGVRGNMVGAIEIGPFDSSFDIEAGMAEAFARRVAKPDSRDPKLRIVRASGSGSDRGPQARNAGPRGEKGKRRYPPKGKGFAPKGKSFKPKGNPHRS